MTRLGEAFIGMALGPFPLAVGRTGAGAFVGVGRGDEGAVPS